MLVKLPLLYRAEVSSPAGWTWRTLFRAVQLDVPEVDPEDCEVSAENLDFGSESRFTLLWHEGSHWLRETPSRTGFGRTYVQKFNPAEAAHVAIMGFGHAWRSFVAKSVDIGLSDADVVMQRWLEKKMPERSKFANQPTRNSSYEREMDRLGGFLQDVRIIGGYLYRRVPEPYFKIALNGNATLSVDPDPGPDGGFRLDRIDDLRSHIEQYCMSGARVVCEEPVVRMPETLEWDDEGVSFERAVAYVKKCVRKGDPTAPEQIRRAGARLYRGIIRLEAGEIDRDAFTENLDAFADVYFRSKRLASSMYIAAALARSAASRWRQRPMLADDEAVRFGM